MSIFVVMNGEYSDKQVCGVYSTKEKAKDAALVYDGRVLRFELDDVPDHPPGTKLFSVEMRKNGDTLSCESVRADNPVQEDFNWGDQWEFFVFAVDSDGAIKVANERRLKLIAENRWDLAEDEDQ